MSADVQNGRVAGIVGEGHAMGSEYGIKRCKRTGGKSSVTADGGGNAECTENGYEKAQGRAGFPDMQGDLLRRPCGQIQRCDRISAIRFFNDSAERAETADGCVNVIVCTAAADQNRR